MNGRSIIIGLLIVCNLTSYQAYTQTYIARTEHFGVYEGLSHTFVTSLVQDERGMLWIGTRDGLNLFDGFSFRQFTTGNSALRLGPIAYIHIAPDGHLYVYTSAVQRPNLISDCQYLDLSTMTLHDVDSSLLQVVVGASSTTLIYMDSMLLTNRQIAYSFKENRAVPFLLPDDFTWTNQVLHYGMDRFLSGTYVDLRHPDVKLSAEAIDDPPMKRFLDAMTSGKISYIHSHNVLYDSIKDALWIEQEGGLKALDGKGEPIEFEDAGALIGFPRSVTSLVAGERLFVGTESGFYIVALEKVRFRNYFVGDDNGPLTQPESRAILVESDSIYTCTEEGLFRSPVSNPTHVDQILSTKNPRNLIRIAPGEVLLGGEGIQLYNLHNGARKEILTFAEGVKNSWGLALIGSTIYASNVDGLFYVPFSENETQTFRGDYIRLTPEGLNQVYQFVTWDSEEIFLVSAVGLFVAKKGLTQIRQIQFKGEEDFASMIAQCTHLIRDDQGDYWLTSLNGGLVQFRLSDTTATIVNQFNKDDGVPTSTFYAVYPDGLGSFWCSTDLGIVQLDTADWSFQFYTEADGMLNTEFNRLSHTRDNDGNIYFGGLDGVTGFSPENFYVNTTAPLHLSILNLEQYSGWERKVVNSLDLYRKNNLIRLAPGDNFFVVEVGLNDLYQASQHQYQYRVADMDEDWLDIQGNRLRIHGLPYGLHTLEVRGKNVRGISGENTLVIPVRVIVPVYLRWWFFLSIGLGLFLIVREYYVSRARRLRVQAGKLEALVDERTGRIAEQARTLQEMQDARSRFFANISHELRTPLTLIKGPVKGLMKEDNSKEQDQHYLKIIDYNAHLLGERIEDLLLLAQSDSGNLELRKTSIKLNRFLERIVDSFSGLAEERRFDLILDNQLAANTVILADGRKLEHVLSNFLSNALKYADQDTRITLTTRRHEEQLIIGVSDEGPGIAPELLDRIFDRFYKGKDTHSGTGIGLALSRDLAQVMHGTAWAESEPGKGSAFYISIPFESSVEDILEEMDAIPVRPATKVSGQQGQKYAARILCVEDNHSMRDYLTAELKDYQVTTCMNGRHALERLDEMAKNASLPDIILSDVMMPEMDGFALAQHLRSSPKYASIPIILLTARAGHEDKLAGLRIGVDDYITKPFDVEELRIRINNLVGRRPMKQEAMQEDGAPITTVDEKWLQAVEQKIRARLHERDFTIDDLADDMHLSRSQFYRRIKAYTGLTPHKYLREARLYHAKELLESGEAPTIAQLAAAVGFEDAGYFSRIYLERFGYRPSEQL